MNKKIKIARLSILSNTALIIIKVIAGVISGSVSIISEAIHSSLDLVAAVIAFISVRISSHPPDKNHPYGHGKFENVSGVIEAVLIIVAAVWIIYEAVKKIMDPGEIGFTGIAIAVMSVSAIVNWIVSKKLYRVAHETDSVALEADALHLKTDVYTSAGVAVGLLIIHLTGFTFLDPVIAIAVALFILKESFSLLNKAFQPLTDSKLPDSEIEAIREAIQKNLAPSMSFHQLRTRKSGSMRYVDVHIDVSGTTTVNESHQICDNIEAGIKAIFKDAEVTIHVEPL